jgi:hypothetical protein
LFFAYEKTVPSSPECGHYGFIAFPNKSAFGCGLILPPLVQTIAKQNKRGAGRGTSKRSGQRRNNAQRLTDVPKTMASDITTMSVVPPSVTQRTCVRSIQTAGIVQSATANVAPTYYFNLANAGIGSAFFDQYRIAAIRFNVKPLNNAVGLVTNSTTSMQSLYCVIDYDDANALANQQAATNYSNCVIIPPGKSCSRTFRPHAALGAYGGSLFTGFANVSDVWLDAGSTTVQHYGVKFWLSSGIAGQTTLLAWDIDIEYFIEMRMVF